MGAKTGATSLPPPMPPAATSAATPSLAAAIPKTMPLPATRLLAEKTPAAESGSAAAASRPNAAVLMANHADQLASGTNGTAAANTMTDVKQGNGHDAMMPDKPAAPSRKRPQALFTDVLNADWGTAIDNVLVDEYDPLNRSKNSFVVVLEAIGTYSTTDYHLKLLYHQQPVIPRDPRRPEPFVFSPEKHKGRWVGTVRTPPMPPGIALLGPRANFIHDDPNPPADASKLWSYKLEKAQNVILLDGHPPQVAVQSPTDPAHRDRNFLKTFAFFDRLKRFAVAYMYLHGAGAENDITRLELIEHMKKPKQQKEIDELLANEDKEWMAHELRQKRVAEGHVETDEERTRRLEDEERIQWSRRGTETQEERRRRHELHAVFEHLVSANRMQVTGKPRKNKDTKQAIANSETLFFKAPRVLAENTAKREINYKKSLDREAKRATGKKRKAPTRLQTTEVIDPNAKAAALEIIPMAATASATASTTTGNGRAATLLENSAQARAAAEKASALTAATRGAAAIADGKTASVDDTKSITQLVEERNAKNMELMASPAVSADARAKLIWVKEMLPQVRKLVFEAVPNRNPALAPKLIPTYKLLTMEDIARDVNTNALMSYCIQPEIYWGNKSLGCGLSLMLKDALYYEPIENKRPIQAFGEAYVSDEMIQMFEDRSFEINHRVAADGSNGSASTSAPAPAPAPAPASATAPAPARAPAPTAASESASAPYNAKRMRTTAPAAAAAATAAPAPPPTPAVVVSNDEDTGDLTAPAEMDE